MSPRTVFVTGGTGYIGSELIPALVDRHHDVHALMRLGSRRTLPAGCRHVVGDALEEGSYAAEVPRGATFVHLIGVSHPAPWKAKQFEAIDLGSVKVALAAAQQAACEHFVYVSVAQPAPVMRAYIAARRRCEDAIRASGLPATFERPWYVLGSGHRWPLFFKPFYALAGALPPMRAMAQRLALLELPQVIAALVWAVEHPPEREQVLDVPRIRELARAA